MDWTAVGAIAGTFSGAAAVLGVVLVYQARAATAREDFHARLDHRFAQVDYRFKQAADATEKDHEAVKQQVRDMATTITQSYVPRREFEMLAGAVNALGPQITSSEQRLTAQVVEVRQRVDQLYGRRGEG